MKNKIWLCGVFVIKILFAPKNMKIPFLKKLYYNFFGGFTSDQVALYDLNKITKKEFLSEFDWYKTRNLNGKNSKILNNKVLFSKYIKKYLPTPKIYCIKEKNKYFDKNYNEIKIEKMLLIIKEKKSVFFKPISSGKGKGVNRIDYKNEKFYLNYKAVSEKKILNLLIKKNNYFISQTIKQAKYLDKIFSKTANTIRLITINDEGKIKLIFAVQRFGDKESIPVDNGSKGGIVAKIDLNTGILSEARSIRNKKVFLTHPDSNEKIKGIITPYFEDIKKNVILAMEKMENIKFIAWDILVTNNGFYVIEANASSGVNILQVFGGQRNKELGNFYKKMKIIK